MVEGILGGILFLALVACARLYREVVRLRKIDVPSAAISSAPELPSANGPDKPAEAKGGPNENNASESLDDSDSPLSPILTPDSGSASSRKSIASGSETEYRQQLLNSLVDGVILLDQNNRISFLNESIKKMLRISDSFKGLSLLEAFRSMELVTLIRNIRESGSVVGYEYEVAGIEDKFFRINGSLGHERTITLVFHDLTLTRRYEQQRQDFVANVSHELRTPLSMISGYVETLIGGAKNNPETLDKFLSIIEKHTNRLTWLIEDLLTISSLESGGITLNIDKTPVITATETVLDELREKATQRNISFHTQIPENLVVLADDGRLHQILVNLVDNAIKYGQPNSDIKISAEFLQDSKLARISINNRGPAIPADVKERIFERFFRIDAARSREQGGTGLGLAIVKHLVHLHGGTVKVESNTSEGTTFSLTIPVTDSGEVHDVCVTHPSS